MDVQANQGVQVRCTILLVDTDNQAIIHKRRSKDLHGNDIQVFRQWFWSLESEPNLHLEFITWTKNNWTDFAESTRTKKEEKEMYARA